MKLNSIFALIVPLRSSVPEAKQDENMMANQMNVLLDRMKDMKTPGSGKFENMKQMLDMMKPGGGGMQPDGKGRKPDGAGMKPDGVRSREDMKALLDVLKIDEPKHPGETDNGHMPDVHRCDACRIVAMFLTDAFQVQIKKSKKELDELQVSYVVDQICNEEDETFKNVGLKVVHGINRLSAAGYETDEFPGETQSGKYWINRFLKHCNHLTGEFDDEFEIYETVRDKPEKALEYEMCYNGKNKDCVRYPAVPGQTQPKIEL